MKSGRETGQILVVVALGVVSLFAIVALVVDGGQLYAEKRNAQQAADNAALASGYAICKSADPVAAGMSAAADNGYDNNGITNSVIVNHPPASGPNAGDNEYTETLVDSTRSTFFAQIIGINELPISARAVSRCRRSFQYAVIALTDRNDVRGLEIDGTALFSVTGGGIMSNSTHPTQSFYQDGGTVTAEMIHAVGGVTCDNPLGCIPAPEGGHQPVEDPLAFVPPPELSPKWPSTGWTIPPAQSTPDAAGTCSSGTGLAADFNGSRTITLNPGTYCYIRGDGGLSYVLNPGIYYIYGSHPTTGYALQVIGNSTISGSGIMFYLAQGAGPVMLDGNANVDLAGCNTSSCGDAVYTGMLFYADRLYNPISPGDDIILTGNTVWTASGTIYAANADLLFWGNATVNNLSSMMVADEIHIGGSSIVTVDYDPGLNVRPPLSVSLVE